MDFEANGSWTSVKPALDKAEEMRLKTGRSHKIVKRGMVYCLFYVVDCEEYDAWYEAQATPTTATVAVPPATEKSAPRENCGRFSYIGHGGTAVRNEAGDIVGRKRGIGQSGY